MTDIERITNMLTIAESYQLVPEVILSCCSYLKLHGNSASLDDAIDYALNEWDIIDILCGNN